MNVRYRIDDQIGGVLRTTPWFRDVPRLIKERDRS